MADFPALPFAADLQAPLVVSTVASRELPSGGSSTPTLVTNRVWYVPGSFEVRWQTPTPDTLGASYPGPGVFGVDTTNFTIDDPSNVS